MQTPSLLRGMAVSLAAAAGAWGAPHSPAFDAAMMQMVEQYVAPNGVTLDELEKNIPSNVAILMGAVLQGQIPHVRRDPALRAPFLALQDECRAYLAGVARRAGNIDRVSGKAMNGDALWSIAMAAANGSYNQFVLDEYRRAPAPGPLVLTAGRADPNAMPQGFAAPQPPETPPPPADARGRLLHEQQELQLNLLGQRPIRTPLPPDGQPAPPADAGVQPVIALYNSGVDAWNASLRLWQSGNFGASKQKCQQAQSIFTQVRQLSPSMISGMSCWFRDPDPRDPAPNWSQLGPFLSSGMGTPPSRSTLRRWNE